VDFISTVVASTTNPPAAGAATTQVFIATGAAMVLTVALMWLGTGHRAGRVHVLERAAGFASRRLGFPGWVALPASVATAALVTAVFGMYWDVSLHIDNGRDPGPLANPAHYFILAGLFGIFSAGFFAIVLPRERPSSTAVRIASDWHAPLGGVLICACGAFALLGFPLDDMWHRIFGQDVTLWGPTHLMLIGGASMTLIGIAALLVEGARSSETAAARVSGAPGYLSRWFTIPLCGGLLLALSTFQAEFDFGVEQFRFVFHPILLMLAAGVGLTATRMIGGRGAAFGAVGFFLLVRGTLTLLVAPVLGESTPHFPLYIVEAAIVEAVALAIPRERPLAFGLASGLGLGTVGLAAEWGWSHVWMPLPWPSALFPEGAVLGFAAAVAGALLGSWAGNRLTVTPAPGVPWLRRGAVAGAVAVTAIVAFALYKPADHGQSATVALTPAPSDGGRMVNADVRLHPGGAADHAEWLTATAWQGGGLVVDRLRRVGEGHYRTTQALPVFGNWKSLIRLHAGRSLSGVPIYLPEDKAIPAKGVPAPAHFTRPFVADHKLLQREQKTRAGWLAAAAYSVVVAIALALLALLAWGLHRLASAPRGPQARAGARRYRRPIRSTTKTSVSSGPMTPPAPRLP
jgi:hypothetical protein